MSSIQPDGVVSSTTSLYVGDLADEVKESDLYDFFKEQGPLVSCKVVRDMNSGKSLCYAFVTFDSVGKATAALNEKNFSMLLTKAVRISWSLRDPSSRRSGEGNLFVKGLEDDTDGKDLLDAFSAIGGVLSCKIPLTAEGKSFGYGYVQMNSSETADRAISGVIRVKSSIVSVSKFLPQNMRRNHPAWTNVFIRNIPLDCTEARLMNRFSVYGKITSVYLGVNAAAGLERKFGFVNFSTHEEATHAVESTNNQSFDGMIMEVCQAKSKEALRMERETEYLKRKGKLRSDMQHQNLYVKNFSPTTTEDELKAVFGHFGTVLSVRIARDKDTNEPKGFGFVCMGSPEEAEAARKGLNGSLSPDYNKALYVTNHQYMAQRRVILATYFQRNMSQQQFLSPSMMPNYMFPQMQPAYLGGGGGGDRPNYQMMSPYQAAAAQQQQQQVPYGYMRGPQDFNQQYNPQFMQQQGQQQQQQQPVVGSMQQPYYLGGNNNYPRGMRGGGSNAYSGIRRRGGGRGQYNAHSRGPQDAGAFQQQQQQQAAAMMMMMNQQPQVMNQQPVQASSSSSSSGGVTGFPSIDVLVKMSTAEARSALGEALYPLVHKLDQAQAGKITGMLLEMDVSELLHLMEAQSALVAKVEEARLVLEKHKHGSA